MFISEQNLLGISKGVFASLKAQTNNPCSVLFFQRIRQKKGKKKQQMTVLSDHRKTPILLIKWLLLFCLKGVFERIENAVLLVDTNSMAPWYCLITFGDNSGSVLGFSTPKSLPCYTWHLLELTAWETHSERRICAIYLNEIRVGPLSFLCLK